MYTSQTVQTSNPILILFLLGFLRNASLPVPTITNIVNLSLTSGQFHLILKESVISLLLKKLTLDKDQLSNYRPISNLSLISKIVEHVVKCRLVDHLTSNKLLNPHKSSCCKHHSTETALSYIHDHLINAIESHKISCLCLLDLSATFDTIDHDILISCLSSQFSFRGSVLSWFESYLSSMQIAGIGTRGTGTCGTGTAGLGHAELGQFCDSFA